MTLPPPPLHAWGHQRSRRALLPQQQDPSGLAGDGSIEDALATLAAAVAGLQVRIRRWEGEARQLSGSCWRHPLSVTLQTAIAAAKSPQPAFPAGGVGLRPDAPAADLEAVRRQRSLRALAAGRGDSEPPVLPMPPALASGVQQALSDFGVPVEAMLSAALALRQVHSERGGALPPSL